MYLFQKLKYKVSKLTRDNFDDFKEKQKMADYIVFDTETTGLNTIKDEPFLFVCGFDEYVYYVEDMTLIPLIIECIKGVILYAHNIKYDTHMLKNIGYDIPNPLFDSKTIARLTTFVDDETNFDLETLGVRYVDEEAKFAGRVIKKHLNTINAERLKQVKNLFKQKFTDVKKIALIFDAYKKRVQFVETEYDAYFDFIDENYKKPNYKDVYDLYPDLMICYAIDDVVILLEYLEKALSAYHDHYTNHFVLQQESALNKVVLDVERVGIKADVDYLIDCRVKTINYRDELYKKLHEITNETFTAGQHEFIKKLLYQKYHIVMKNCDVFALEQALKSTQNEEAKEVISIILELRTVDKWISTYIDGMLNRIVEGRIYTNIDNNGTVTGRVSCDLQQQPKKPLLTRDGVELFHPRKVFIPDKNHSLYFLDFDQMELRVQAIYTLMTSDGDINLCRAFIPFKCKNIITGEEFKVGTREWNDFEWVDEDGNFWTPTDVHTLTTLKAFPELSISSPNFDECRSLGKKANFLKNYGGGVNALADMLDVDIETIYAINKGYYEAFPNVKIYQKWVEKTILSQGYVENLYGRRYYVQNSENIYKSINHVIQGTCADFVKQKEVLIDNYLREHNLKTKMVLFIHDEIVFLVPNDEEDKILELKNILNDYSFEIPIVCGIDKTTTNWAEKYEVK